MKKILIIIMTLITVVNLVACGKTSSKQTAMIEQNSKKWEQQIEDMQTISYNGQDQMFSPGFIAQSMGQLQKVNPYVVRGTVYELSKMDNPDNVAFTKVKFHVDEVISGEKNLKNQTIYLAMQSGITTTNKWYHNQNQTREADHEIFVKYGEFSLPKIGSQMIIGLRPTNKKEPTKYIKAMKMSNFDFEKSYDIGMPEYNTWIKNPGDQQFHSNNPKAEQKLKTNSKMKQGIDNLTKELNQKYNK